MKGIDRFFLPQKKHFVAFRQNSCFKSGFQKYNGRQDVKFNSKKHKELC